MNLPQLLMRTVLGRRLPIVEGTIAVEGAHEEIRIGRDKYGIAYIDAESEEDAFFGLGFCHGQDRAGQLEIVVRAVRGTLAEVVGCDALAIDRLSRRIGFAGAGARQFETNDRDVQDQLRAYVRGINEGTRKGSRRKAHELTLLGCPPTQWKAEDCQGYLVLLCFALAANWDAELARLKTLLEDGPEALRAIDPTYPSWMGVTIDPDARVGNTLKFLERDLEAFIKSFGMGGGSNAWVIGGQRTATGRPLVANDPHLIPAAPSQWYLASLSCPDWKATGATFVGVPAIGMGHNGSAAWGVTAAHAINTDLFLEDLHEDGRHVRSAEGWEECEITQEIIKVKGRADVVETVMHTPRGPIISPALDGVGTAISLSATWLASRPYRGLYSLHKAQSSEDMHRFFDQGVVSTISFVYALADGTIGWEFSSELPRRRKGWGLIPRPGWEPDAGWTGELVDREALPCGKDPAAGYYATANNMPLPVDEDVYLGVDFLDGFRQQAIAEALSERDDWTVAATAKLQLSTRSIPWELIRSTLLSHPARSEGARRGLELLGAWDGQVSVDSIPATYFETLMVRFVAGIIETHAPRSARVQRGKGLTALLPHNLLITRRFGHVVHLLNEQPEDFLPSSWTAFIEATLEATWAECEEQLGPPGPKWRWGHLRRVTLTHPFGEKKIGAALFNVPDIPCPGDATTIHQAAVDLMEPYGNPVGLATARMVIDVGEWDSSRFVLLGGQSGNPFSPHYRDQIEMWSRGEGVPIPHTPQAVERAITRRLVLVPMEASPAS